jgi:DNA-binding transcriptional ArsR family regulator
MSKSSTDIIMYKNDDKTGKIQLKHDILRKAVLTLRSVNHPLRRKIIAMLKKDEKMTVTEIYVQLRLEQSVASQHLAILRRSEILKTKREGKFIYYSLDYDRLSKIDSLINDLANY